eukprot:TRINITY_DN4672_c0_g2_i1.p1 TRINITY_DN4672_c0_g2~~TRINITY_DN4672_c0_g2_i1.p1  ORF type:complete len:451 (-),score=137.30 TRINITY_DN4672_c0_g2_i1:101-1429(-)
MIRRPPRSTPLYSSAASDVYKRQLLNVIGGIKQIDCKYFSSSMDKEEIKLIVSDMSDQVERNVSQGVRTRNQPGAKAREAAFENKGVKKTIRKLKTGAPAALKRKSNRNQSEEEDAAMEDAYEPEIPVVEQPLSKSVELAINSEEQIKDLSMQVVGSFLYKPHISLPNLTPYIQRVIEIRVAREYICKANKAYRQRNFWGSDIYTSDSDIVCILQHNAMFGIKELPPDKIAGVAVYCRVTKGRNSYQSSLRNGIRSRKLGAFEGCSIKPESYKMLEDLGVIEELIQVARVMPEVLPESFRKCPPMNSTRVVVPPETEVIFNLSLEPAYKFSLPAFADYGLDPALRTSNILFENALYFETEDKRYELAIDETSYKLSEVLSPFEKGSAFMGKHTVPLDKKYAKTLLSGAKWEEFKWSESCDLHIGEIVIKGISNFKYFPLQIK